MHGINVQLYGLNHGRDEVERRCAGGRSEFLIADVDKGGTDFEIRSPWRNSISAPLSMALKSDQTRLPLA
jgi:hypothetical protein